MTSTPGETATAPALLPAAPRQAGGRLPYAHERSRQPMPPGYGTPVLAQERITFTASCPACGRDTEWVEIREDTRVRCTVNCTCPLPL